uniref:Uncharacterized protein n=1 Tax=Oryza barthii TaxID=65489 RepID=A0A0D3G0W6_9ORYZ
MCSGVPELRLSFTEANARLRRIVFEALKIMLHLESEEAYQIQKPCQGTLEASKLSYKHYVAV